jgi:hypothetical protein
MRRLLVLILSAAIRLYQVTLAKILPPSCRFHPSCSQYALEAVQGHGPFKGSWLAAKRIMRCHPFHPGGYDPVPAPSQKPTTASGKS